MSMSKSLVLALCGTALLLSGCDSLRDAAGLTKRSPDEFAVTTKAPLVIPPDFNLRPPRPGAAPVNQTDPSTSAQQALFNNSDPETVAAGMRGNYSPAEKLLLAHAGVQNSDPNVRTELKSDLRAIQGADESFTDRVLGTKPSPFTGQPVNADAEVERRNRAAAQRQQRAKPKDSGGWFDWL
jgi:hypothetical protein